MRSVGDRYVRQTRALADTPIYYIIATTGPQVRAARKFVEHIDQPTDLMVSKLKEARVDLPFSRASTRLSSGV